MKRVITKATRLATLIMFITIMTMLMAPLAFCYEVMNENFAQDAVDASNVVGGTFVTLPTGESGWQADISELATGSDTPNYIQYNISEFNTITEGTIQFWIQRNREGGAVYQSNGNPETYDTVFELLSPDNSTSFSLMIMWDYGRSVNESAIMLNYFDWSLSGNIKHVWGGDIIPLGYKPAVGDWVHIALTFGENAGDNKVYVNGRRVKKRIFIDKSSEGGEQGQFSTYLSKADRIRIGIETGGHENYPGGTSLLYHSVLNNFIINNEILNKFDLNRFSFTGMATNLKAEYVEPEVVLTWTAAKSVDVIGYNVYRKELPDGSFEQISSEVAETTYNDADTVDGKSYVYIVNGVDVDGNEANASNEAKITIVSEFYRVTETSTDNDPTSLTGVYADGKITITWGEPRGITPSGYNVYRRTGEGAAKFTKLNTSPVTQTSYLDSDITAGNVYYYSVTALDENGKEGKYPSEIKVEASSVAVASVSIDPVRAVREGEEVTVTASGTPGQRALLLIPGVLNNQLMTESSNAGVYFFTFNAPEGNIDKADVIVAIGGVSKKATSSFTVDNYPPTEIIGLDIRNDWENEINIEWQAATEADFVKYNIYRSTEPITTLVGLSPLSSIYNRDTTDYWDRKVTPNLTYYYAVTAVDEAGNISDIGSVVSAKVLQDTSLPVIYSVEESSKGVTLREGGILTVTVEAEPDGKASFSIGDVIVDVPLNSDERVGLYIGSYTVKSTDVVNDYIIVKLTDSSDNSSTYASNYKVNIDGSTPTDNIPPVIDSISENSWSIAGFSGKLVAGDMITVDMTGEPGGVALFDITGVVEKVKMTEDPDNPGNYSGTYTFLTGEYAEDTTVVGSLADDAGNVTTLAASSKFTVDTNVNIEVITSENSIPADEKTRVDVVAKVTDLNGDEISGHKIKFTMTTTDEYTGIVGGGKYTDFKDLVGGRLRTEWRGETDAFGEVSATYRAGFAAKTAMFLAKDLTSGNIGVGYLTSYVSASIDITLTPKTNQRRLRTVGRGVYISVTATPEKLTADGVSKSRIKAKVTDVRGQPVSGERIVFSMSSDNGKLNAIDQETDLRGIAEAVYTAGTKIGTVTITALDTTAGISGSTMIILMSDAPAKVYLSADPISLPADGKSKSILKVQVSDINDNPNQGAVVEYDIVKGRGSLDMDINETDRNGETENGYRAGNTVEVVTVQAKVTSRIPSEAEINRANGTIFVGEIYKDFETGAVKEWLKEVGDTIEKGEVVLRISTDSGDYDVTAKYAGTLDSIKKYERDDFDIGETLGVIEIE